MNSKLRKSLKTMYLLTNSRGNTPVTIIILGLGLAIIASTYSLIAKKHQYFDDRQNQSVQLIMDTIVTIVNNNDSWNFTVLATENAATNINCVVDAGGCPIPPPNNLKKPLALKDSGDSLVSYGSFGFNSYGKKCSTFNLATGDDDCPFRYDLTWTPVCKKNGNCINPAVQVDGELKVAFKNKVRNINPKNYKFKIIR